MIKIYFVPSPTNRRPTREHLLIGQGLRNNRRVKLVGDAKLADFIFQFYYIPRHCRDYVRPAYPPKKTVIVDYHDSPHWSLPFSCLAYFKRSWVEMVRQKNYVVKRVFPRPAHFHPLSMAIMDEFIIKEEMERGIVLSCTIRPHGAHVNRPRVLELIKRMDIKGKTQIGALNRGTMKRFDDVDMRNYFRMLKRSQIVVTCNPGKWEGDHRTWEAFANGALVFVDRMYTPMKHPLIDGKHCIIYDVSDKGLTELWKKILYFIAHPILARVIAKEGHNFTMKYHRASNRIDEILEAIL